MFHCGIRPAVVWTTESCRPGLLPMVGPTHVGYKPCSHLYCRGWETKSEKGSELKIMTLKALRLMALAGVSPTVHSPCLLSTSCTAKTQAKARHRRAAGIAWPGAAAGRNMRRVMVLEYLTHWQGAAGAGLYWECLAPQSRNAGLALIVSIVQMELVPLELHFCGFTQPISESDSAHKHVFAGGRISTRSAVGRVIHRYFLCGYLSLLWGPIAWGSVT